MKKVYCKNCKYFDNAMGIAYLYCLQLYTKKITNEYTGEIKYTNERSVSPLELNSDGKCKYYKRKWWKLWVN